MKNVIQLVVLLIIMGCVVLSYILESWIPIIAVVSVPLTGLFFAFLIAKPKNYVYIINPPDSYQYVDDDRFDEEQRKDQLN